MHQENYFVSSKKVTCYFDADFSYLENLVSKQNTVLITDEHVFCIIQINLMAGKQ